MDSWYLMPDQPWRSFLRWARRAMLPHDHYLQQFVITCGPQLTWSLVRRMCVWLWITRAPGLSVVAILVCLEPVQFCQHGSWHCSNNNSNDTQEILECLPMTYIYAVQCKVKRQNGAVYPLLKWGGWGWGEGERECLVWNIQEWIFVHNIHRRCWISASAVLHQRRLDMAYSQLKSVSFSVKTFLFYYSDVCSYNETCSFEDCWFNFNQVENVFHMFIYIDF